jgi:hypothetical protein
VRALLGRGGHEGCMMEDGEAKGVLDEGRKRSWKS